MKTNNLDLNAYTVEELNEVETLETDGGGERIAYYLGYAAGVVVQSVANVADGFQHLFDGKFNI